MKLLPPPGPERWRAIGLLVVILLVAAWYVPGVLFPDATPPSSAIRTPGTNAAVPGQSAPAAPGSRGSKKADLDVPVVVNLAALEPGDSTSPETGRNPFRYGEPPKPPAPAYLPPPAPVYVPPPPPPPPPPPQVELKLIGTILVPGEAGLRASFRDKRDIQFTGYEGDIIDGRYKVVKVAEKSAVVSFLDGTGQRTLRVGG